MLQTTTPGGWGGVGYYRLHGSLKVCYSAYATEYLVALASRLAEAAAMTPASCIFDNPALGVATADALAELGRLRCMDSVHEECARSTDVPAHLAS